MAAADMPIAIPAFAPVDNAFVDGEVGGVVSAGWSGEDVDVGVISGAEVVEGLGRVVVVGKVDVMVAFV